MKEAKSAVIRAGIVGLGRWGQRLVDSVQGHSVESSKLIRFDACWTRTPSNSLDYANQRRMNMASSFEHILSDPNLDAIVLATPHSLHASQVKACAAAGKAVYVEKPLALTLNDANEVVSACERAGVVLAVGHNRRFLPAVQAVIEMARRGELGTLLHIEGNFSGSFGLDYDSSAWRASESEAPAGGLTLMGIHTLDAMISLMGMIQSVSAMSLRQVLKIKLDDTSSCSLRFSNGTSGYMSTLTASARLWRLQLFGTKGWVHVLDHERLELSILGKNFEQRNFEPLDAERIALEHFALAVAGKASFPIEIAQVLNGIAACEAFIESVQSQSRIITIS